MSNSTKLDRYKLDTIFAEDRVTNTTYRTDLATGERRTAVQTTWADRRIIGSGGFSIVILQESAGGQSRAVKKLFKGMANINYSHELTVLSRVAERQDLFVVFHGWYENVDFVFIAMEYIQHGDLGQYIKSSNSRSPGDSREITRQLLEGIATLHAMKICHRDLKPQNVLIASPFPIWVKIADFGVSKYFKRTVLETRLGSQGYVAPELLGLLPRPATSNTYTNAVDMWALGCIVHEVLTSEIPFLDRAPEDVETVMSGLDTIPDPSISPQTDITALKEFCDAKVEFPAQCLRQSGASEAAVEFVMTLLVANPHARLSASEARQSRWLLEQEQEEVADRAVSDNIPPTDGPAATEVDLTVFSELCPGESDMPTVPPTVTLSQPNVLAAILAPHTSVQQSSGAATESKIASLNTSPALVRRLSYSRLSLLTYALYGKPSPKFSNGYCLPRTIHTSTSASGSTAAAQDIRSSHFSDVVMPGMGQLKTPEELWFSIQQSGRTRSGRPSKAMNDGEQIAARSNMGMRQEQKRKPDDLFGKLPPTAWGKPLMRLRGVPLSHISINLQRSRSVRKKERVGDKNRLARILVCTTCTERSAKEQERELTAKQPATRGTEWINQFSWNGKTNYDVPLTIEIGPSFGLRKSITRSKSSTSFEGQVAITSSECSDHTGSGDALIADIGRRLSGLRMDGHRVADQAGAAEWVNTGPERSATTSRHVGAWPIRRQYAKPIVGEHEEDKLSLSRLGRRILHPALSIIQYMGWKRD